jgi:hypothetical protein
MGDEDSTALSFGIPCFAEIKLVHNKVAQQIYRGHPTYCGEDPWHNWVNVEWKGLDGRMSEVPAEIQFFINMNENVFPYTRYIKGYRGPGTYAVIQLMKEDTNFHGNSQLLRRGVHKTDASNKNRVFHFERVNSFVVNPTFVVDNMGCQRNPFLF